MYSSATVRSRRGDPEADGHAAADSGANGDAVAITRANNHIPNGR
ncbi:MAG: hypothetical protein R2844_17325 [Caldilineales bacterium]